MTHLFERQGFGPGPYRLVSVEECTTHTVALDAGQDLGFWPEPAVAAGTCDSCGQCIKDVYTLESSVGTRFATGCDCVLKAFADFLGDPVVQEVRKAKSEAKQRRRRATVARRERVQNRARLRMFASRCGAELLADLRINHRIVRDIRAGLIRFGGISEKQVALVVKIAREEREKPVEVLVPVPENAGRVRVEGEAVSVKMQRNDYGDRLVMMVRVGDVATGAYLLWGSVPEVYHDLLEAEHKAAGGDGPLWGDGDHPLRGRRVAFMAAVTRSDRDVHFGFFKRPTKPELLS
jgi:hypothetical protein